MPAALIMSTVWANCLLLVERLKWRWSTTPTFIFAACRTGWCHIKAWSCPPTSSGFILTSIVPFWRPRFAFSISVFRPTRFRAGPLPSHSGCWLITARLIRLRATAAGLAHAAPSSKRRYCQTCRNCCRWSIPRGRIRQASIICLSCLRRAASNCRVRCAC